MRLTEEQAVQIRHWRNQQGYSWRMVAEQTAAMWPEMKLFPPSQAKGIQLCDAAMELLGETVEDGWD